AGVSILPRRAVAMEVGIRMLSAVPLGIGGLVRPIAIIHRKGKGLTPAVARFIDVLRKARDVADEIPTGSRAMTGKADRP
ncbi:MAG: LysR substrate-binding domain-containing protein, partial [Anaerolineales bacterium]